MKAYSLLIVTFLILSNTNCTSQNKTEINKNNLTNTTQKSKIEKIELKEQTRGTRRITTFSPGLKIFSLNETVTHSPLSVDDWKRISEQAGQIELSTISNLKAPTSSRFTDAALASSISITSDGKVYTSSTFDSGVPPKELEKLYKEIITNNNK
ncbi:hypothetical protein F3J23_00285 [Chryseobacterium sp. Tr-659]|uniref:hypothetical protein n=1 Tax=Chryseobacterium sp. Tr-659 TaxID=2608340 RepID=UPI0014210742|nr:hypothetical protein [Chryseobacterium sp. Tr-659]NIF03870.1 hypothetical protein [Chryseobacterium sp. Tr-659]